MMRAVSAPSDPKTATLLVSCPDRRGIVAGLAQLLYGHGANILDSDQHSDPEAGQFFQRIRFDVSELHTDRVTLERAIAEVGARFSMTWRLSSSTATSRTFGYGDSNIRAAASLAFARSSSVALASSAPGA